VRKGIDFNGEFFGVVAAYAKREHFPHVKIAARADSGRINPVRYRRVSARKIV
jgi:hypothetical protein